MPTPLADVDDVAVRVGRAFTSDETARVAALIDDASAAVRLFCGQRWETGTVAVRRRVRYGRVRLSQRDVASVTSVQDVDGNDVAYEWDGLDVVAVSPVATSFLTDRLLDGTVVDVTYEVTSTVPPAVRAVVCQVAARAFGRPSDSTGLQSESIQGYSYSVGAAAAAGPLGLLSDERATLDRFRRVGGVAWMRT